VKTLLNPSVKRRPSAAQALEHAWIKKTCH
jgi:Ca2+-binding EF-hand superfamily protein